MVPHTARMIMEKLPKIFPHSLISRFRDSNWPPRSPDFSASDYILWGYLKSRVFETRSITLGKHQANSKEAIHDVLQRVMDDFTKRLQSASLHKGGIYCILCSKSEQHMYHTQFPRFVLQVNVSVFYLLNETEFIQNRK
jgi:hypothetical protein